MHQIVVSKLRHQHSRCTTRVLRTIKVSKFATYHDVETSLSHPLPQPSPPTPDVETSLSPSAWPMVCYGGAVTSPRPGCRYARQTNPAAPPPPSNFRSRIGYWGDVIKAISFVLTCCTVYVGFQEYYRKDEETLSKVLQKRISSCKHKTSSPSPYIERTTILEDIDYLVKNTPYSIVVGGPRGSGKTSVVKEALKGKNALFITLNQADGSIRNVAESVITSMQLPTYGITMVPEKVVEMALTSLKRMNQDSLPPILVVEIDSLCKGAVIQDLLLTMKQWGFERGLVRPIVVISSPLSAFGMKLPPVELRASL